MDDYVYTQNIDEEKRTGILFPTGVFTCTANYFV